MSEQLFSTRQRYMLLASLQDREYEHHCAHDDDATGYLSGHAPEGKL